MSYSIVVALPYASTTVAVRLVQSPYAMPYIRNCHSIAAEMRLYRPVQTSVIRELASFTKRRTLSTRSTAFSKMPSYAYRVAFPMGSVTDVSRPAPS